MFSIYPNSLRHLAQAIRVIILNLNYLRVAWMLVSEDFFKRKNLYRSECLEIFSVQILDVAKNSV